ncbi:sterol desaturase family protein [Shewanella intestini]|uniref:Sterol desaturase family protein n=1 Tax=Shewanella intestini TaxID=2017544 RepID=A0ABS5I578_9GAMM|nr:MULTISPECIES: sterol desaturase family protein [Shewanella]MBR9729184.1 sterol desaturase family protein [Shewanella intestini]MRG37245.1 sterol desaturase family protein [Shewanella sp. XMDDZSB0408]
MQELSLFFSTLFSSTLAEVASIAQYPFDANKRIFGWYLLGAVVLALPVYWQTSRSKSVQGLFRFLFPKQVYLSRSAGHDYALLVCNKLIKALLYAPLILTMVPVALMLSDTLEQSFGVLEPLTSNAVMVMGIFTVLLFLLDDASRYLLHLVLHKVPFLWAFHAVHHSAKVLTPFTIYRSHPVESYLYACRMALAQGCAVGIGYYLFGANLKMYDVLGANIFVFIFNVCGANLRHSHIWLSWGNRGEGWFISPAQHQVHHSIAIEHRDKNLGSALSIWDRLGGSLVKASEVDPATLKIGIHNDAGHQSLMGIYLSPFKQAWRAITTAKVVSRVVKTSSTQR